MRNGGSHSRAVVETVTSGTAAARSRLAASWSRSLNKHGLDPGRHSEAQRLDGSDLSERRAVLERFRAVAADELDHLGRLVATSGCGLFLTDVDGVILERRCPDGDAADFDSWGLRTGAVWSEAAEGTNGIGTCLTEDRCVIIHRDQHFKAQNTALSCVGTPIYGARGELICALDVSSARYDQTDAMNMLFARAARDCVQRIEAAHFRACHTGLRIVLAETDTADGTALLAVDRDDLVVGATRAARIAFGFGIDRPINPVPAADVTGAGTRGLQEAERAEVMRALARSNGKITAAAKDLGIGRATLYRRMQALNIPKRS